MNIARTAYLEQIFDRTKNFLRVSFESYQSQLQITISSVTTSWREQ
jgi:hypothetical protein